MAWTIEFSQKADDQLGKIGTAEAKRITDFLRKRLAVRENPRTLGEPLKGMLRPFWRYRVGDYRIICRLENDVLTVFVVDIDHRSRVYKHRE
jgi:mRNA interferase RelE/StbE